MAIVGINLEAKKKFVPSSDPAKGTDKATVFEIGTLSSGVVGYIMDSIVEFQNDIFIRGKEGQEKKEVKVRIPLNRSSYMFAKYGLRGWNNFVDEKGNHIPFECVEEIIPGVGSIQVVKEELLNRIPFDVIGEIATEVNSENEVSKEDEKNLKKR